jgi:hypothetical protein
VATHCREIEPVSSGWPIPLQTDLVHDLSRIGSLKSGKLEEREKTQLEFWQSVPLGFSEEDKRCDE